MFTRRLPFIFIGIVVTIPYPYRFSFFLAQKRWPYSNYLFLPLVTRVLLVERQVIAQRHELSMAMEILNAVEESTLPFQISHSEQQ